jgi:16S rRNA (cytosine967-C5)-methyltransferase
VSPNVSPGRRVAYATVRRVFEHDAFADRAFAAEAACLELDGRERSFAMALAYATVQRRATLDHVIARLANRPPRKLDPPVLAALRLGLAQLLLLDGVAEHAAVHESVELAKGDGRSGSGLVNAVLRRATREGREILGALDDATPASAAILHSVPEWLAELWWAQLGPERARALLGAINRPPESAVRVNTLVAAPGEVAAALGIPSRPAPGIPEGIVLDAPFDAAGSPAWRRGEIMPQSRGSMMVAGVLAPGPGDRVLDLCAAPGGKTTHLAALMGDQGELVAVERHPGRAQALQRTLARMRVSCARVRVGDAVVDPVDGAPFDRVLVDPPCSGLGTLQSRPDLRWRTSPQRIAELAQLQARILRAAARATGAGGRLVYSVCTISRAESDDVVEAFLAEHPEWTADPPIRTAPDTDATDGFYIVALQRH